MIRKFIHSESPYQGFNDKDYELSLYQEWGSKDPIFERMIEEVKPSLILEVGTWLGGSAVNMANICKEKGLNSEIVCIDTWLGATEFWKDHGDETRYKALKLKNGYPSVYYQFLANIKKTGHDDIITPFPLSSLNAARVLKDFKVQADLIYIDGSHEYPDVYYDIVFYYDLLRDGGILFGDDFHWVLENLKKVELEKGWKIEQDTTGKQDKWIIRK